MVQTLSYSTRKLPQHWAESSRFPASRKRSVWRKWKLKKKTAFSEEDRSLTWSRSTSGSLEPTILSRVMRTCLQLFFEMMMFRNSIQNGTKFFYQWRKSHLMTSWKACKNSEYESLRNSRPYWNCTIWRFIRRKLDLIVTDWRHWWKEVSRRIYEWRILKPETEIVRQTPWSRIRRWNSVNKEVWEIVGKADGQCSKGDNWSFRHDMNKRAKLTQPNPSPSSYMQQNGRHAWRTRSPRGKSPGGRMSRWPCKDYLKGTCTNLFCEKWHPPECLFYKSESGCRFGEKCSYAHRQVDEQHSKRSKNNGAKSAVAMLKITRQFGCAFQEMEPPKSLRRFYGRAQIHWSQSDVFDSPKPWYVMLTFETRIHRLGWPGDPHQRNPNTPKFEDRSQKETEWQERYAHKAAWRLAKNIFKIKGET